MDVGWANDSSQTQLTRSAATGLSAEPKLPGGRMPRRDGEKSRNVQLTSRKCRVVDGVDAAHGLARALFPRITQFSKRTAPGAEWRQKKPTLTSLAPSSTVTPRRWRGALVGAMGAVAQPEADLVGVLAEAQVQSADDGAIVLARVHVEGGQIVP